MSTGTESSSRSAGKGKARVEEGVKAEEEQVISSELRGLLSKKIIVVEKPKDDRRDMEGRLR